MLVMKWTCFSSYARTEVGRRTINETRFPVILHFNVAFFSLDFLS